MEFKSLKEQYIELMANKISVSVDDLTDNEKVIIEAGFELFSEKMEDIKILNDENKRISIELLNLRSSNDNTPYRHYDDEDDY